MSPSLEVVEPRSLAEANNPPLVAFHSAPKEKKAARGAGVVL